LIKQEIKGQRQNILASLARLLLKELGNIGQFRLATSATNFMMYLHSLQKLIVSIPGALLSGFTTLQPLLFPKNQFSLVSSASFLKYKI
jgi:hypothetical protein